MYFYLGFSFLGFGVVDKQMINLFEGSKDFGCSIFILVDREVQACFK